MDHPVLTAFIHFWIYVQIQVVLNLFISISELKVRVKLIDVKTTFLKYWLDYCTISKKRLQNFLVVVTQLARNSFEIFDYFRFFLCITILRFFLNIVLSWIFLTLTFVLLSIFIHLCVYFELDVILGISYDGSYFTFLIFMMFISFAPNLQIRINIK